MLISYIFFCASYFCSFKTPKSKPTFVYNWYTFMTQSMCKTTLFLFHNQMSGKNDRWRLFILKCSFQYVLTSHKSSGFAANLISIYHFLAYSPSISQEDFRGLFLSFSALNLIRSGSVHNLAECFIILLNNLFRLHNIKKQYLSVLRNVWPIFHLLSTDCFCPVFWMFKQVELKCGTRHLRLPRAFSFS